MQKLVSINRARLGIDPADSAADQAYCQATGAADRLCVYGRLTRAGSDSHVLAHMGGTWHFATFRGFMQRSDRVIEPSVERTAASGPRYIWAPGGDILEGEVLNSALLRDAWTTLDFRVGENGVRLLCEVSTERGPVISNIYAAADASRTQLLMLDGMNVHADAGPGR